MKFSTLFFLFVITIFMSSTDAIAMKCNLFEQHLQQPDQRLINAFDTAIQSFKKYLEILNKNSKYKNFQETIVMINGVYESLYKIIQEDESLLLVFIEFKDTPEIKNKIKEIKNIFDNFYKVFLVSTPSYFLFNYASKKQKEQQQVMIRFLSNKYHCDVLAQGEKEIGELLFTDGFGEVKFSVSDEKNSQELLLNLSLNQINTLQIDEQIGEAGYLIKAVEYLCGEEIIPECQGSKQKNQAIFSRAKSNAQVIQNIKALINGIDITDNIMQYNFDEYKMTSYASCFSECLNLDRAQVVIFEAHKGSVFSIVQLHDGRLASCSDDCTIKIWDLKAKSPVATLEGHKSWIRSIKQLDDDRLASCSDDCTIKIWNLKSNKCVTTLEGHKTLIRDIKQLRDGRLASCSDDAMIKMWDLKSNKSFTTLEWCKGSVLFVEQLGNDRLAFFSDDKTIKIWDLESNKYIATLKGHTHRIREVRHLDNDHLISCSDDKTIKIWNLHTHDCIVTLQGHTGRINGIRQLYDDRLVSCSDDKTIKIWDLNTNKCVATLEGHAEEIRGIRQLDDGRLASCSDDGTIKVWNLYSDLSLEQIALVVHLERCSKDKRVMSLGDGWHEFFADLPDYFKKRFEQFVI